MFVQYFKKQLTCIHAHMYPYTTSTDNPMTLGKRLLIPGEGWCEFLMYSNSPPPQQVASLSHKFTVKATLRWGHTANYNTAIGNSISHQTGWLCFSCQCFICHVCYPVAYLVSPAVITQHRKAVSKAMKATLATHSCFNSSIWPKKLTEQHRQFFPVYYIG